ncbi:MAG: hypothetical protein ABIH72_00365 [archaeon]
MSDSASNSRKRIFNPMDYSWVIQGDMLEGCMEVYVLDDSGNLSHIVYRKITNEIVSETPYPLSDKQCNIVTGGKPEGTGNHAHLTRCQFITRQIISNLAEKKESSEEGGLAAQLT